MDRTKLCYYPKNINQNICQLINIIFNFTPWQKYLGYKTWGHNLTTFGIWKNNNSKTLTYFVAFLFLRPQSCCIWIKMFVIKRWIEKSFYFHVKFTISRNFIITIKILFNKNSSRKKDISTSWYMELTWSFMKQYRIYMKLKKYVKLIENSTRSRFSCLKKCIVFKLILTTTIYEGSD